jgi:hypothetical protein
MNTAVRFHYSIEGGGIELPRVESVSVPVKEITEKKSEGSIGYLLHRRAILLLFFSTLFLNVAELIFLIVFSYHELNYDNNGRLIVATNVFIACTFLLGFLWESVIVYNKNSSAGKYVFPIIFWIPVFIAGILSGITMIFTRFDNINATPLFYISYIPAFLFALLILFMIGYCIFCSHKLPDQMW